MGLATALPSQYGARQEGTGSTPSAGCIALLAAHHQAPDAGEIVELPDHHVVRAGANVLSELAPLVVAHEQIARPVRAVRDWLVLLAGAVGAAQAVDEAQVGAANDHLSPRG
jgi:hypothetical protein